MPALQEQHGAHDAPPPFRLDVQLHDLLKKSPAPRPILVPGRQAEKFPEPVFPQHPELMTQDDNYEENLERARAGKRHWPAPLVYRAMNGWLSSRISNHACCRGNFIRSLPTFLRNGNAISIASVKGMTEDVAKRSIDWLHSTTCRVLAFMGGEPLLRPQLVHKASYYAAKKGFWIYMPTNARLLRPDVIDRLADAGVAIFNFAVDGVDEKPGLPKALNPIREYFDYLIRKQYKYGYARSSSTSTFVAIILRM